MKVLLRILYAISGAIIMIGVLMEKGVDLRVRV